MTNRTSLVQNCAKMKVNFLRNYDYILHWIYRLGTTVMYVMSCILTLNSEIGWGPCLCEGPAGKILDWLSSDDVSLLH